LDEEQDGLQPFLNLFLLVVPEEMLYLILLTLISMSNWERSQKSQPEESW
jgi:hypothetical protein